MAKRDYYETLGISKGSSDSDIKKAFRSKAKELHPDRNSGSSKAEEEFKAVNQAYDVLKDPNKRQHMINTVMLPLKMVVLAIREEAQIFHQHFQMYLKTSSGTLWGDPHEEDRALLLGGVRISGII